MAATEDVIQHLRGGGLACFPTETLWSLSCDAFDQEAVRRVFAAKGRPQGVPLAVGFATWESARDAVEVTPLAEGLARRYLPGPLSIVLHRLDDRLAHVAPGMDTLSVRVPDHPVAKQILQACGPLVMTSANRHNAGDPLTAGDVADALHGVAHLMVVGRESVPGHASTVVDATGSGPRVLRQGALDIAPP